MKLPKLPASWLYALDRVTATASSYRASVQLSEKASAQVLKGRPSRSLGHGRPAASTPFRVRRAPSAGISNVHTP